MLTGVFAVKAVNPAGADGLLHGFSTGGLKVLGIQVLGVVAAVAYATALTYGLLKLVDKLVGLRVGIDEEREGLDATQHGETGYHMGLASSGHPTSSYIEE